MVVYSAGDHVLLHVTSHPSKIHFLSESRSTCNGLFRKADPYSSGAMGKHYCARHFEHFKVSNGYPV